MKNRETVPTLIVSAGTAATQAYRDFLDDPMRQPGTNKVYGQRARGFLHWSQVQGLTLETIAADSVAAYAAEIRAMKSQHEAIIYLTPVRGLFRHLVASGVLAENPCDSSRACEPAKSAQGPVDGKPPHRKPTVGGFPLLDLLAMLGDMEAETLQQVFDDEDIAVSLLEQVRWPDGQKCPYCGADCGDSRPRRTVCRACAVPFAITTGTMFEELQVPVRAWFAVIHQLYFAESVLPNDELISRFGFSLSVLLALFRRLGEEIAREGIPLGDELKRAIEVRNKELMQEQAGRAIIRYAELEEVRDRLVRALEAGTSVDDLPEGMTLEQTIEALELRIADENRYVFTVEGGYLLRVPALPDEPSTGADEKVGPVASKA
jgi:hypothetical protein